MKTYYSWMFAVLYLALSRGPSLTNQQKAECDGINRYVIPNFKTNWFKAMEYCHYLGLKLTRVQSMDEQNAIVKIIETTDKDNSTTMWTGGNDLGDSDNYHWYSTGNRVTWFNWVQQKDNGYNHRNDQYNRRGHCLHFVYQTELNEWRWSTDECVQNKYFVCERF
ncbi:C-type lectin 37Da-like [Ochlerotatus camptorhynchus]|uniref:C-type lectin 37Da-like n=1 Tax=Ochlerotatus camptorhynchus TaxID=644619 RepID=UPI0031E1930D